MVRDTVPSSFVSPGTLWSLIGAYTQFDARRRQLSAYEDQFSHWFDEMCNGLVDENETNIAINENQNLAADDASDDGEYEEVSGELLKKEKEKKERVDESMRQRQKQVCLDFLLVLFRHFL